jgi:hypothetical protein
MYWIIYIIGYITSYYLTRHVVKKKTDRQWLWGDVIMVMIFSTVSWISVVIALTFYIIDLLEDDDNKPPRWL